VTSRAPRASRLVGAVAVVAALLGCSATPPSQPPPSVGPPATGASPSAPPATASAPAPVPTSDPAALALAFFRRDGATARVDIHGTEQLDWGTLEYEGEAYVRGQDYLVRIQAKDQDRIVWSELHLGSRTWRREIGVSAWAELSGDQATHPRLIAVLAGLPRLEALGTGNVSGTPTLRFAAPADTQLDLVTVFERTKATKQQDRGTLEIDTDMLGRPVRVVVHLVSDDFDYSEVLPSGLAVPGRTYDFTFTFDTAASIVLPNPSEQLSAYAADRFGVRLEVPATLTLDEQLSEYDELIEMVRPGLVVRIGSYSVSKSAAADQRQLLMQAASVAAQDVVGSLAGKMTSAESLTIDGQPAVIMAFSSLPASDHEYFHLEAIFVRGRHVYFVAWHAFHASGAGDLVDRYRLEQMLQTVQIG